MLKQAPLASHVPQLNKTPRKQTLPPRGKDGWASFHKIMKETGVLIPLPHPEHPRQLFELLGLFGQ